MKKGKKGAAQAEVFFGFVPASVFAEKRRAILDRHSPSPQEDRDRHLAQIVSDMHALSTLYAKQPALQQVIQPEGATEPMVPWIAHHTSLDEGRFQIKLVGSEITSPCLPSDLLPLLEITSHSDMSALQAFILRRQPSLAKGPRGAQLWLFNGSVAPVIPLHRTA